MGTTLEQIIEEEYEAIKRCCERKLFYSDDAHDVAHKAIVKALAFVRRHPDFEADKWSAWLWGVVNNTILDKIRYDDRRIGKYLGIDEYIAPQTGSDKKSLIVSRACGTDNNCQEIGFHTDLASDTHDMILSDMIGNLISTRLKPCERASIILHYYYGYTREEIGAILYPEEDSEKSKNRCGTAIHRARLKLKKLLCIPSVAAQLAA